MAKVKEVTDEEITEFPENEGVPHSGVDGQFDKTIKGGIIKTVDGTLRNAKGYEVDEQGTILDPHELDEDSTF